MTRMAMQKQQLLKDSIKNIKALRHLTGNNETVVLVEQALEALQVAL